MNPTRMNNIYQNAWPYFLCLVFACSDSPSEYVPKDDHFTYAIGESTESKRNPVVPLWEYRFRKTWLEDCDTTYRDGYEIILCDEIDFHGDDDDSHLITILLDPEDGQKQLKIGIIREGSDLRGHHIGSKSYRLNKEHASIDPSFEVKLIDLENGVQYPSVKGHVEIKRFKFLEYIEGELYSVFEDTDGSEIVISGDFAVSYKEKARKTPA